ncbi:putative PIN domain-like protein [Lyophyllum shimeji]|uniref:PIN domain-like protein n=1 Tax=Lyophyllum shimeji TaxID=47721 RepID=A0A9P3PZ44_LYOSH|nr:putative PIN domain-like protein [Lyophyllum shimeji]
MGITGLWKTVEPASSEHSLLNLATIEGYMRNPERRYLLLGVDMNLWIDSCQAAFQTAGLHTHAGENPELRAFHFKLCRYLKLPVVLVFVPDGQGRPSVKRGRAVRSQPLWMGEYVQELVTAFGFYVHQAPGEAEAELAKLNSLGMIDSILTDDSDTLVFGGESIIRSVPRSNNFDRILLYTADSIEHSDGVKLTRGGLLLFALLAGGDYDPGIDGCGAKTAHALAECGFGDTLLDAANSMSGTAMQAFLYGWREELRSELESNSRGHLNRQSPELAQKITADFPNLAVLDSYLNPLTSWSLESPNKIPNTADWRSREPMIPRITAFCVQHFGWGRNHAVVKHFRAKLWEGVAFRMVCSPLIRYNSTTHKLATPMANMVVLSHTTSKTLVSRSTPSRRLKISTRNFQALMGPCWADVLLEGSAIHVHVPTCILEQSAASPVLKMHTEATAVITNEIIDLTNSETEILDDDAEYFLLRDH